ncbi:hypothetical protein BH11PLA2_BH11PLA2_26610 [soil metagenome]
MLLCGNFDTIMFGTMFAESERLNLLLQLRRYPEAEEHARECLARNPDWANGYGHLARALMAQKKNGEALAAARTGVSKAPDDAWIHSILAWVHLEGDDPRSALQSVEAALRFYPQFGWAHYLKSLAYERLGNYQAMLNAAKAGLQHEPHDETLLGQYGWAQKNLGQRRAALRTAAEGIRDYPNAARFWNLRGAVHYELAQTEGFIAQFRHFRLANVAYRETIRLDPSEGGYQRNYVNCDHHHRRQIITPLLIVVFLLCTGLAIIPNSESPSVWPSILMGIWIGLAINWNRWKPVYRIVTWRWIGLESQPLNISERRTARWAWRAFGLIIFVNITAMLYRWIL